MNSIFQNDLEEIISTPLIDWEELRNKKIFITGATGLIGSILVKAIILKNKKEKLDIKLILLVRNKKEAEKIFGEENIEYIISSIEKYKPTNLEIDYIIHGASPTKSKYFIEKPVEKKDI